MVHAHEQKTPDATSWLRFPTDALSQVTDLIRLTSVFCGLFRVTPPFAYTTKGGGLHLTLPTQGQFYLEGIAGTDVAPMLIETGDVLITTHGLPSRFQYPLGVPAAPDSPLTFVQDSSRPRAGEIECLAMACRLDSAHHGLLTEFLPHAIHLKRATPGLTRWMKLTVDMFRAEQQASLPGRGSVLARLAEIACVQALRIWVEHMPPDSKGWLRGLKDDRIALALHCIHKNPECRWTVGALARQAGMSRTVFATQFKRLVGEPPMKYVTRWRMHRSAALLERAGGIKSVVDATGYKSAATFRINFKRHFGYLPKEFCGGNR